jgi:uncharacterized protein
MSDVSLTLAGEQLYLLSERALYWPGASTLVVADLHWGKPAPFPSPGVPVPFATTSDDLSRLDSALQRTSARRLVVLGDLFDTKTSRIPSHTLAELRRWRSLAGTFEILLIRGNHDRHSGDPPSDLQINWINSPAFVPPFVFRHESADTDGAYSVAGHAHPGMTLVGRGLQRETLPCFLIGRQRAIIPAFGSFTRLGVVEPGPDDRVFVVSQDEVLEVASPIDLGPNAYPTPLHELSHSDAPQ